MNLFSQAGLLNASKNGDNFLILLCSAFWWYVLNGGRSSWGSSWQVSRVIILLGKLAPEKFERSLTFIILKLIVHCHRSWEGFRAGLFDSFCLSVSNSRRNDHDDLRVTTLSHPFSHFDFSYRNKRGNRTRCTVCAVSVWVGLHYGTYKWMT